MSKLHQVLAVEKDVQAQTAVIIKETMKVLESHHLFNGAKKTLHMFDSARQQEEAGQAQEMAITTDVPARLNHMFPFLTNHLNCVFAKEATNAIAKADVTVDGEVLLKDVPATMLLALEREFVKYRDVLKKIPTLQSGIDYTLDPNMPGNVYKTNTPVKTQKLEKTIVDKVVVKADEHHPAQVKERAINEQVGEYTEIRWSGCITSRYKADILTKLESFIQAVKKARSKANDATVVKTDSVQAVFDWLMD